MTSVIFPGQGSQYVGMVKDFNDNFKQAQLAFEEIEEYSHINLRDIIFNDKENKLNITKYTQICIFASSYAIFKTYINEKNISINAFNVMMGHSLGEYTALACSQKISPKDCSLILKKRGELMNDAVPPNETGMAALIGKDSNFIQNIIDKNKLNLQIANDNSPIQIVLSGKKKDLIENKDLFLNNNVKKFVYLNVSAAFHSKFMINAQEELSQKIEELTFIDNEINIISNYDADIHNKTFSIKKNLQKQMANKVNWTLSIKKLEDLGEKNIIEIGPNKVLSGLVSRISKNFDIKSITKISDLEL